MYIYVTYTIRNLAALDVLRQGHNVSALRAWRASDLSAMLNLQILQRFSYKIEIWLIVLISIRELTMLNVESSSLFSTIVIYVVSISLNLAPKLKRSAQLSVMIKPLYSLYVSCSLKKLLILYLPTKVSTLSKGSISVQLPVLLKYGLKVYNSVNISAERIFVTFRCVISACISPE